jgi:hypothetical protein
MCEAGLIDREAIFAKSRRREADDILCPSSVYCVFSEFILFRLRPAFLIGNLVPIELHPG